MRASNWYILLQSHHFVTNRFMLSFLPCSHLCVSITTLASLFHAAIHYAILRDLLTSGSAAINKPAYHAACSHCCRPRVHISLPNFNTHQLQNSIAAPNIHARSHGREANSSRGKEPSPPTLDNRYHPYRTPAAGQPSRKSSNNQQSFPSSTGQSGPAACALCLGRFRHNIHKCTSEFLWDKRTKTRCCRNTEGHITNPEGRELCYDWQRPRGCSSSSQSHVHECSGCGAKDHGAQDCPQGERIQSTHAV